MGNTKYMVEKQRRKEGREKGRGREEEGRKEERRRKKSWQWFGRFLLRGPGTLRAPRYTQSSPLGH